MDYELKNEIIKLLSKGVRLDGRKPNEYRDVKVERGVSINAHGSAKVTIGDTVVIAGVKMETIAPYPDAPEDGSMMINVELTPMSNPEFESGPPSILAIELARVTDRAIRESKSLDTKKLCIKAGEKAWMVVVDVCTINDAGNLFDAIALAAMVAMQETRLPGFDGENIDYKHMTDEKLPLSKAPISVTVFKHGNYLTLDPMTEEEKVFDARLTVGVLEDGTLCSMQKGGEVSVTQEDILKMVDMAVQGSKVLRSKL